MDRQRALSALERMGRIIAEMKEMTPESKTVRKLEDKLRAAEVLYDKGDITITQDDVDQAIEEARDRVGDEYASLLTAPEYVEK